VGIRFRSRCRRRKDLTSCGYSIEVSLTSVMSDLSVMNRNENIKLKSHAVQLRVNCRSSTDLLVQCLATSGDRQRSKQLALHLNTSVFALASSHNRKELLPTLLLHCDTIPRYQILTPRRAARLEGHERSNLAGFHGAQMLGVGDNSRNLGLKLLSPSVQPRSQLCGANLTAPPHHQSLRKRQWTSWILGSLALKSYY
jgi:hypothetical protein